MADANPPTCTISSATLTAPGRNDVYTTKAKVTYTASATVPSQHESAVSTGTASYSGPYETGGGENDLEYDCWYVGTRSQTQYVYTYDTLVYNWTFTPEGTATGASGSVEYITGLTKGAKNTLKGKVKVTCTKYTQKQTRSKTWYEGYTLERASVEDDWGEPQYYDTEPYSSYGAWSNSGTATSTTGAAEATKDTETIDVWTRPGTFTEYNGFSGGPTGTIIQSSSGLTVGKVANWCTHCNKFAHWYNQNDTDTAGSSCQATANGLITAGWYNACVDACADSTTRPAKVTGGPTGTIITPSVFSNLGAAISKEDS